MTDKEHDEQLMKLIDECNEHIAALNRLVEDNTRRLEWLLSEVEGMCRGDAC